VGVSGFEPEIDDQMKDQTSEVLSTVESRNFFFVVERHYDSRRGLIATSA